MPAATHDVKTLYVIDGYAQFFRAYHAIRSQMTSPVTKEPTNMTFGFVGMLLKLLRGEGRAFGGRRPDYVAIALDVSGDRGTFRSRVYPEYKATRSAPPEDLGPQVDRCLALLAEIGVPVLGAEGFEADDVIATLADRFCETPDLRLRVISKDKDLKQLLKDGCFELYDIHTDELIDTAALMEETGLRPDQVVDMLALMGDTVDNVPGVPGIGKKTAAQLIAQYGSLDALLADADNIKGKRGENIRAARDKLALSRELVTLRHDAEFDFELASARVESLRLDRLMPILKELGFNRYQDELKTLIGAEAAERAAAEPPPQGSTRGVANLGAAPAAEAGSQGFFNWLEERAEEQAPGGSAGAAPRADLHYRTVRTKEDLAELVRELEAAEAVAVDTETTGLRPMLARLAGLSFSTRPCTGWYVPVRTPNPDEHLDEATVLEALRPVLEDPDKPKIGHNLKFDMLILRRSGITLRGLVPLRGQSPGTGNQALGGAESQNGSPPVPSSPLPGPSGRRAWPGGDSMIASYLIDASRSSHSLDNLALALLKHTCIPITDLIGVGKKQKRFDEVPLEQAATYAVEDADITLRLMRAQEPDLDAMGLRPLYENVELPLVEVLAELEYNGVLVDPDELDRQRERLQARLDDIRKKIDAEAWESIDRHFDPDSPKQLAEALFNKPTDDPPGLGIRPQRRTKTGYSTDAEVLEKLASDPEVSSPIPGLILEHRQLAKLINTYLQNLKDEIHPETKRIHAHFNQTVAATGRLSSSDPNLQNIPIRTDVGREIRRAFIAPPGHVLITADYSQIELRLLAHLSRDPALIEAFRSGEDIHTAVAAQIHGVPPGEVTREQRSGAKMVNFGIVYGVTPFGLARRLGISSKEAAEIIDGYKRRFAGIATFLAECIQQAESRGYVQTMLGRRRPIPDIYSRQPNRRALAERLAINSVVQGSAADLIKVAMVDLHARIRQAAEGAGPAGEPLAGVRMLLQIHDELVFEAPEDQAEPARRIIVERMEAAMDLSVPLRVESGISRDWFDAK